MKFLERFELIDQGLPLVLATVDVVWKRNTDHGRRHDLPDNTRFVQFADKDRASFGMPDDVVDGIRAGGRVDGHGDRNVGQDPFGTVFCENGNFVAGCQVESLKCRGDAACDIFRFGECMRSYLATDRLIQESAVGHFLCPIHQCLMCRYEFAHRSEAEVCWIHR